MLRDLLDHFDGDVDKAIGAYNGGVRTPNPAYASGVKNVAEYARRVLEHATVLDKQPPAGMKLAKGQPLPGNPPEPLPWWIIDP